MAAAEGYSVDRSHLTSVSEEFLGNRLKEAADVRLLTPADSINAGKEYIHIGGNDASERKRRFVQEELVSLLQNEVDVLQTEIGDVCLYETMRKLGAARRRATGAEEVVDEGKLVISELRELLGEASKKIRKLEQQLGAADKRIVTLDEQLAAANKRILTLEEQRDAADKEHGDEIKSLKDSLFRAWQRLDESDQKRNEELGERKKKEASSDATIEKLRKELHDVKKEAVVELRSDFNEQSSLVSVRDAVADLLVRMKLLECESRVMAVERKARMTELESNEGEDNLFAHLLEKMQAIK